MLDIILNNMKYAYMVLALGIVISLIMMAKAALDLLKDVKGITDGLASIQTKVSAIQDTTQAISKSVNRSKNVILTGVSATALYRLVFNVPKSKKKQNKERFDAIVKEASTLSTLLKH